MYSIKKKIEKKNIQKEYTNKLKTRFNDFFDGDFKYIF